MRECQWKRGIPAHLEQAAIPVIALDAGAAIGKRDFHQSAASRLHSVSISGGMAEGVGGAGQPSGRVERLRHQRDDLPVRGLARDGNHVPRRVQSIADDDAIGHGGDLARQRIVAVTGGRRLATGTEMSAAAILVKLKDGAGGIISRAGTIRSAGIIESFNLDHPGPRRFRADPQIGAREQFADGTVERNPGNAFKNRSGFAGARERRVGPPGTHNGQGALRVGAIFIQLAASVAAKHSFKFAMVRARRPKPVGGKEIIRRVKSRPGGLALDVDAFVRADDAVRA